MHADDPIDVRDFDVMKRLVNAIIRFENGSNPYNCEVDTGLFLAGIEPKQE